MKKIIPLLLLVSLAFASCNKSKIIEEERVFSSDVWNRFTPETFEFSINDDDYYYNISLSTEVDTALFRYNTLPLIVNIYSPTGENRMFYSAIPLKENDRWKGEGRGRYRFATQRIRSFFSFNGEGKYRMEIGQTTSQYDLEGVHSISLSIESTQIDYSDL